MTSPELDRANPFAWMVDRVLDHEGGAKFVMDPRDPGGATRWGISLSFAQYQKARFDLDGDGDVDADDIRILPKADAVLAYRDSFYDRVRGDDLPLWAAYSAFDMAVNQGVVAAAKTLQRSIWVVADGVIGPQTIATVWSADPLGTLAEFTARRAKKYGETRNFDRFGLGWMRRAIDVHDAARSLILP